MATPTAASYTDTAASDTFNNDTGTLASTDRDSGQTLSYGITGGTVSGGASTKAGSYGSLSVNTSTGAYTYTPNATAINALTANSTDTFTVTVSDGNGGSNTATYTVNLTAANDTPVVTSTNSATIAENMAASTVLYTVTGTDRDAGQALTYSLIGADANLLDINPNTGAVTLKAAANFEAKNSYSFNVVVIDSGSDNLSHTQAVTIAITDANDAPTGTLTINGVVKQGGILTANDTLADEDGITNKTYKWFADGQPIAGATQSNLILGQAQVGKVITVQASYTDGEGRSEVIISTGTLAVLNVNDATTGEVTITGETGIGQILTASNNLADLDGINQRNVSYLWQAKNASGQWQDVTSDNGIQATDATYTVQAKYALQELRVLARFTDGQGTAEVVVSAANVKAGGLPPVVVAAVAPSTPVERTPQISVVDVASAPPPSFISAGTVNAIAVAAKTSPVVEAPAPSPVASIVSLGVSSSSGSATSGLRAMDVRRDVVMERGEQASYTLPAGTFVHSSAAARVTLTARLADGRPLPDFVKFNPTTGTFVIDAKQGQKVEQLQLVVNAVDDKGQSASTTVVIKLKEKSGKTSMLEKPLLSGKLSLSEQIRLSDKPAGALAELASLSKAFAASTAERSRA